MTHQRRSIIALLIGLTLFFNIERFDFGMLNIINMDSLVYVMGILTVLSIITIPPLWRAPFLVLLACWVGIYLVVKVFIFHHVLLGGIHTYLSITEVALLSLLIWLAYQVRRNLHDFEEAVKNITLSDVGRHILTLHEASENVQLEMTRSRRYQHPLSVIVVAMKSESVRAALHRTVQEVQRAMMTHYVVTSLARVIGRQLRRTDSVLDQREQGRFIILSPDTNVASSTVVAERIKAAATEELGVSVSCGIAVFPEDALTFDELVSRAESNLHRPAELTQVPSYVPISSEPA